MERAAVARVGVPGNRNRSSTVTVQGYAAKDAISPGHLKALGIPLKAGREFDERDHRHSPRTAAVNETFARRYFPNRSPAGYRIGPGVVAGACYDSLRGQPAPAVFSDFA